MDISPNLDKIAKEGFVSFLKNGDLSSYSEKIDEDLNIDNLEKLLRIHFLLKDNVIEFVRDLPKRIRRIKTTTRIFENESDCEIKGRIIWDRTFRGRMKRGSLKGTSFITRNNERNYAISENLVLEELLGTINSIIENELDKAFKSDYSWVSKWVNKESKKLLQDIYLKNIYLRRIKEQKSKSQKSVNVTYRMIDQTLRSRNIIYQDAAELLLKYRKLMNYDMDETDARELLKSTFIKPERPEVIFELYWTIKLIKEYSKDRKPTYMILDEGNNLVAKWEDDEFTYKIYHDSTGNFKFYEPLEDVDLPEEDGYIKRDLNAKKKWNGFVEELIGIESGESLWGGRPDILLEKSKKISKGSEESEELVEVIIGEVKYTENKRYAAQGLKELMEYMSFIKGKKNLYIEGDTEKIFDSEKISGRLFLDDVNIRKDSINKVRISTINSVED